MSQPQLQPDDGVEDIVVHANGDAGLAGAAPQDTSKTVVHYRVDLPPCFHGDGKDKESFALWKIRLELAVKACADGQKLDIATILPTRLSGDALAYWLSLSPAVKQDYDQCAAKLNDVFGRKEFLLHFQTFVNARQRLPKEPLEVYAAEITRLVLEAFPNYGEPAIAMERFRRFVAGLDPILQSKCHEHGAATLEDALAVACKWERAQEALRLLPPPLPVTTTPYATTLTTREEPLSAMVSTKHEKNQAEGSNEILDAIKQLSRDVQTLKLHVATPGHDMSHARQSHAPCSDFSKHVYDHFDYSRSDRGRERYRRTPSVSPVRDARSSTATYHQPSSRSYREYGSSRCSPDHYVRRRSPDHRDRLQSSGFSPPAFHRDHLSSYVRHSRPRSPERWRPSQHHGDKSPSYRDYDRDSTFDAGRHRSPSARSGRDRQKQYDRDHHVTFSEDHYSQGKEWQ